MCHDRRMELTFLGGARTVTGSRHLVDTGRARVLIDCGMFQGGPDETIRNRVPLGFDPATLDAVVLTHAHLDHCGLLPLLVHEGFRGAIVCTAATAELARLVLLDSAKLQEEFAKRAARHAKRDPGRAAHDAARNATEYSELLRLAAEGAESPGGPDPEELLREAGPEVMLAPRRPAVHRGRRRPHAVDVPDRPLRHGARGGATASTSRSPTPATSSARRSCACGSRARAAGATRSSSSRATSAGPARRSSATRRRSPRRDFVLCESTYGGREHEPAGEAINTLADVVNDAVRRKGVLLIPSFAIGRTQEIVWELSRLLDAGRIPELPVYLDSPMAKSASEVYRNHPEAYDEETAMRC